MKWLLTSVVILAGVIGPSLAPVGAHCVGALMAQEQEKKLPPGDWCQYPPIREEHAHACACHRECVTDEDGNVRVANDAQCQTYCTEQNCRCPIKGCP